MKVFKKINKPVVKGTTSETYKSVAEVDNFQNIPKTPEQIITQEKRAAALAKAREEKKTRTEAGEVIARKNPREVWEEDKTSLRKAVNAGCYECCGGENYVNSIRYCGIFTCPFWFVRPYGKDITPEMCDEWEQEQIVKNGREIAKEQQESE